MPAAGRGRPACCGRRIPPLHGRRRWRACRFTSSPSQRRPGSKSAAAGEGRVSGVPGGQQVRLQVQHVGAVARPHQRLGIVGAGSARRASGRSSGRRHAGRPQGQGVEAMGCIFADAHYTFTAPRQGPSNARPASPRPDRPDGRTPGAAHAHAVPADARRFYRERRACHPARPARGGRRARPAGRRPARRHPAAAVRTAPRHLAAPGAGVLPRRRLGHRRPRHARRAVPPAVPRPAAARWCRWTTAWAPSTASRPRWTTAWPPCAGCAPRRRAGAGRHAHRAGRRQRRRQPGGGHGHR
jgi:hypothetical protein